MTIGDFRVRRGFTLIELLVVMAIIGVLAAIAIPRYRRTKDSAFASTMMADLRNLATSQDAYFTDHQTYTTTLTSAQFRSSAGVSVTISAASSTGWAASAAHASSTRTCSISFGLGATDDGRPVCN
jgi:prepilin-type N-terminal cleavage/methylation domain-containing protein